MINENSVQLAIDVEDFLLERHATVEDTLVVSVLLLAGAAHQEGDKDAKLFEAFKDLYEKAHNLLVKDLEKGDNNAD